MGIRISPRSIEQMALTFAQDETIGNNGSNTNSYKVKFVANSAGTLQTGSIYAAYGADPYLRISAPNDSGAETAVLDIKDTVLAFTADNAVSIGSSSNRPKELYLSALTEKSLVYAGTSGLLTALGAATNGQIPIGSTNNNPVLAALTGTANQVTVTNGAGTITLSGPQDLATGSSPTFVDLTLSDQLLVSGVGPHAIGGSVTTSVQLTVLGSFAGNNALWLNSTISPLAGGEAFLFQGGAGGIVEAASGTHADFGTVKLVPPTITAGGASLTNASTLKITNAPTGATNNYALWVDDGVTRFDGNVGFGGATSFGTDLAGGIAVANGTAASTSPLDAFQVWSADRGGTAGKAGLHLRTEDGTQHVFADLVGIGTLTPQALVDVNVTHADFATARFHGGRDAGTSFIAISTASATATDLSAIALYKSRGTHAARTAVLDGDEIGKIEFSGFTDSIKASAKIWALAGTGYGASGNDSPGELLLGTTPDGSATVSERWRITSSGHLLAGTDNTYDIGASGATRPRHVYIAGNATIGTNVIMGNDGKLQRDVNATITASITQTQGQGALTAEINEVSVVANANDTVTLPSAAAGLVITVINNGANTMQIFPASGDNLGAGLDTAETLAAGSNKTYVAYNSVNWETY